MNLKDLSHFLLIPNAGSNLEATLYHLEPSNDFAKNSFVLLPYQNPQTKKISPAYYKVVNQKHILIDTLSKSNHSTKPIQLLSQTSKSKYIQKITDLKHHIQLGNVYELNYCIEFFAVEISIDPLQVFLQLLKLTKAPYSALLKLGDDYTICASPELFLKKEGKTLSTKPIKGTIRRGADKIEDADLKEQLFTSVKERTENVMAVDVARNDLSQIAAKGSVQVNKLYNIESFETVHQMVSTVSCELKEGISFQNILDATFPMASMTGAPKLRAMTLIDAFEDFERKNYSGAMGLIDENEDYTLSVIIRSIFYNQKNKRLSLAVGGAITYLCEPEKEYEECLLKAKALLKALNARID